MVEASRIGVPVFFVIGSIMVLFSVTVPVVPVFPVEVEVVVLLVPVFPLVVPVEFSFVVVLPVVVLPVVVVPVVVVLLVPPLVDVVVPVLVPVEAVLWLFPEEITRSSFLASSFSRLLPSSI